MAIITFIRLSFKHIVLRAQYLKLRADIWRDNLS